MLPVDTICLAQGIQSTGRVLQFLGARNAAEISDGIRRRVHNRDTTDVWGVIVETNLLLVRMDCSYFCLSRGKGGHYEPSPPQPCIRVTE
jgi:hypothetical protein